MLTRRFLFLFTLIMLYAGSTSAQKATIKGTVTDNNQSPIEVATIHVEGTINGTITDLQGRYSFTVESRDSVVISYSMIGYKTRKKTLINPQGVITLNVTLYPVDIELGEVTINDKQREANAVKELKMGRSGLVPDATGGSVESFLATQAGVSSNNELSTQYNVRGGNFDENSVYVNGIEIYRPQLQRAGQQEGLSFINPDMVEKIGFSTGGFEAKYGDKMSSVLDITYKKPRQFEGSAGASLLGANAYIGYGNKKVSIASSVRYKTNRYLLSTLDTKGEYNPDFIDWQTYMAWHPNEHWNVGVIANLSQNRYNFIPKSRTTSFGTANSVKELMVYFDGQEKDLFNTTFGAFTADYTVNAYNQLSFQYSVFKSKEEETYDIMGQYWLSQIEAKENLGVGTYMEHARNYLTYTVNNLGVSGKHQFGSHRLQWGTELKIEKIDDSQREWEMRDSSGYSLPHSPEALNLIYSLRSQNNITNSRFSAYLQDTYKFTTPWGLWTLNAGLRASYWEWNKETIISPRAALGLIPKFNENFTFRLSTGVYYQAPFYKEFRDTTAINGIATVVLNRDIKSQRSIQVVLAADYRFRVGERPFIYTAEFYYKVLSNLIPYNINNMRIVYYGQNCASGYATGLDMKIFGEFVPGTDSWLSLSLMRTEEKINGKWIPRPADQRYNISLFLTDYFPGTDRWKMILRFNYADGFPFGPPHTGREKQTFRAPAYRRVDIGMSYRLLNNEEKIYRTGLAGCLKNVWLGVDVLNLLEISNVNSYYWVTDVYDHQYAVPNYLTTRLINARILVEF